MTTPDAIHYRDRVFAELGTPFFCFRGETQVERLIEGCRQLGWSVKGTAYKVRKLVSPPTKGCR
jgi:hypothetical protein